MTSQEDLGMGELVGSLRPSAVVDHVPALAVSACRAGSENYLAERLNQWIVRNNDLKRQAADAITRIIAANTALDSVIDRCRRDAAEAEARALSLEAQLKAAREALNEALHFITNIDNSHKSVRLIRATLSQITEAKK